MERSAESLEWNALGPEVSCTEGCGVGDGAFSNVGSGDGERVPDNREEGAAVGDSVGE